MPERNQHGSPNHEQQQADAHVLGRLLAAQNVAFALPDVFRMAEFYAQILLTIPGIAACRVCMEGESAQAGEITGEACTTCANLRHPALENGSPRLNRGEVPCRLTEQPGVRGMAVASPRHHFGFFVFRVDHAALIDLYQPFIGNLASYVALILEDRRQNDLLQKANDELERKVMERTRELTAANEALSAYRGHLEKLVRERTTELENKTAMLERMNKLFVGRELRMVELKNRIRTLEENPVKSTAAQTADEAERK